MKHTLKALQESRTHPASAANAGGQEGVPDQKKQVGVDGTTGEAVP